MLGTQSPMFLRCLPEIRPGAPSYTPDVSRAVYCSSAARTQTANVTIEDHDIVPRWRRQFARSATRQGTFVSEPLSIIRLRTKRRDKLLSLGFPRRQQVGDRDTLCRRRLGNSDSYDHRRRPFGACCILTSPNYGMSVLEEKNGKGCSNNGNYRPGWRIFNKAAIDKRLSCPWNKETFVVVQYRTDR